MKVILKHFPEDLNWPSFSLSNKIGKSTDDFAGTMIAFGNV